MYMHLMKRHEICLTIFKNKKAKQILVLELKVLSNSRPIRDDALNGLPHLEPTFY